MVDYVVVLRRTIDSLPKNTPDVRERVYSRARQTVRSKLESVEPPPSAGLIERQLSALEEAIRTVESDFAPAIEPETPPAPEPLADIIATPAQERVTERAFVPDAPAMPVVPEPPAMPVAPPAMPQAATPPVFTPPAFTPPVFTPPAAPQAARQAAAPVPPQPYEDEFADVFGPDDDGAQTAAALDTPLMPELPRRVAAPARRKAGWLMPAAIAGVVLIAGAGAWSQRDALSALFAPAAPETPAAEAPAAPAPAPAQEPADPDAPQKFTQRLNPDGTEADAGAGEAAGEASFAPFQPGDAAAAPEPAPAAPEAPAAPAPEPAPAPAEPAPPAAGQAEAPQPGAPAAEPSGQGIEIGQKAIFYEERTSGAEGSALPGAVVWSVVRESPGGDRPPEPAIRGELRIPENGVNVRMTLRRNGDATLPASHILEMVVTLPDAFAGGAIVEVQRVNLKPTEENAGVSLVAVPVRISDGFFLVALDQAEAARGRNLQLLAEQNWIDIPVVYRTGRRALFTMEKGLTGQQVFKQVLDAWAAQPLN